MRHFSPISARPLLLAIFGLGLTNLALSLVFPDARFTILLGDHWQALSLALALGFLARLIIRCVRNKEGSRHDALGQTLFQDNQVQTNEEVIEYDDSNNGFLLERARVMDLAENLPFPDAVYEIVSYNNWCTQPFKINPGELAWLTSHEQFEDWVRRANKLRSAAYHVGDAGLREDGTVDAVRDKWIATNPGFSEDTYKRAISYGYQMAR